MKPLATVLKFSLVIALVALSGIHNFANAQKRPNILIIVADDMGFSDWGGFGGEIRTPNLDKLAKAGARLTNFYTAPTCSPTRAMLMTGIDHHMVGLGTMAEALQPNQAGKPGYEGHLNERAVTLPELMRDAGYTTMLSGKWHLGRGIEQDPSRKGFDRSFTLLEGGASHFGDAAMMYANYTPTYRENGKRTQVPLDFYSTEFFTQKIINWLEAKKGDRPFFGYLAFTAPHDPLHVPDSWLNKYSGFYDAGYDALSERRFRRMIDMRIIPKTASRFKRPPFVPAWKDLRPEQRRRSSRAMEVYAAMIENIDQNIGRLIETLKKLDLYDNTVIVFFSDNGANGATMAQYPGTGKEWVERNSDNRFENLGRRGSRIAVGPGWALASMTPFRMYKAFISEGGIRSPFIIAGPGVNRPGQVSGTVADVRDIMPTVLQFAGVKHPARFGGRNVLAMQGRSMVPFLAGTAESVHSAKSVFGFELFGWRAVRVGNWKATWISRPFGVSEWELFDLSKDPGETRDLSNQEPAKLLDLRQKWEQYAKNVGVVLPERSIVNSP